MIFIKITNQYVILYNVATSRYVPLISLKAVNKTTKNS